MGAMGASYLAQTAAERRGQRNAQQDWKNRAPLNTSRRDSPLFYRWSANRAYDREAKRLMEEST